MYDNHVHVTGMPIDDKNKLLVKEKLEASLKANKVNSFFGIISPGSLYNTKEVNNPQYYHFFDVDSTGLNIVRELGGDPAISLSLEIIGLDDILQRMNNEGIDLVKLFYFGEANIKEFISKLSDIDVKAILIHTPSKFEVIEPVFDLVSKHDIQLLLGHGCYKSADLINKVKDYGFLVDTSINPIDNIEYWIDNGAMNNLIFGSDYPCGANGVVDWGAQKREISKLGKLFNLISDRVGHEYFR